VTLALVSPVAPADMSQRTLPRVSPATVTDVTPAAGLSESLCQESVLCQAPGLAIDTVDNPSPHRAH